MSYRANIPKMYVFSALIGFQLWMPVWVVFLQERGLSLGQIGLLDAISWLTIAAAEVPTGVVADVWGRKASLIVGALFHGFGVFGILAGVLSPLFLIAYFAWGLSMTFWSGAQEAFVYDSLRAEGLEHSFTGVSGRWSAISQGSSALAGLAGAAVGAYDLRLCFAFTGVACLTGALVGLSFREPPRGDQAARDGGGYRAVLTRGVRIALLQPRVRYLVLLGAILMLFPLLLTISMFQPYAREAGVPIWALGLIFLGMRLASMAGSLAAPWVAVRLRREWLLVLATTLIAGFQTLLWFVAAQPAVVLICGVAFAASVVRPVLSAMLNDSIPSEQRATIISLQSLALTLVLAGVQPALFAIGGRTSMALAVGLSGLLLAVMATPVLILLHRSPAPVVDAAPAELAVATD